MLDKEKNIAMTGWFAHTGSKCKRCGLEHGPFHMAEQPQQELWGCAQCGAGVICEGPGQPTCDQAADIYMSIAR